MSTEYTEETLQRLRAGLPPEKLALLEQRLRGAGRGGPGGQRRGIPRLAPGEPRRLSFTQQRLWFLDQLSPGLAAYNIAAGLRLQGALDPAALAAALGEAVRRHEVLRTTFDSIRGEPIPVVAPAGDFQVPLVDLGGLPAAGREREAERLAVEDGFRPFDLARGPLFRVQLLRLSAADHVALLCLHHIVSDGWSMGVLVREFGILYQAFRLRQPSPLPEPALQYTDYAHWQRRLLESPELAAQLAYWRGRLAGELPVLDLPTDRPRPGVRTYCGAVESLPLPAGLLREIDRLCRDEEVTRFMVLVAAFKTLLLRSTGQEDLLAGSPVANRNRSEVEGVIGPFINTVVLRTDLSGDPDFRTLLRRVRDTTVGAYAHQDVPFEKLVEELLPVRDVSRPPVFQILITFENTPIEPLRLPELELSPYAPRLGRAQFDLSLIFVETGGRITVLLDRDVELFDRTTAQRMLAHFEALLAAAAARPGSRLSELPMLLEGERQQLLLEWNDAPEGAADGTLLDLFRSQVERRPAEVAAEFQGRTLTYRDLDEWTSRLAGHLHGLGAGPETLVGVCVERSLEMVAALLGVLKAGAAYVPLDPQYPQERLSFMLADSGLAILLTQEHLEPRFAGEPVRLARPDGEGPPLEAAAEAGHLAYVIYTSGSTGRPKGVQITHGALANFLRSMARRPGMGHEDRLLAVTTFSFDIAGLEVFLPLVTGGRVIVAGREAAADGPALAAALDGATCMQATPATWRLLVECGWPGGAGLKALCGGEALPRSLADPLLARGVDLWNVYGPTETTIWSSVCRVGSDDDPVPFGRVLERTQMYVVDRALRPVPLGAAGELLIGGDGLSRGYLRRPDLTAERFIPDPFAASPGGRLYRTGDLVRFRGDGLLQFLGRIDHQVKLRGFRIELGEVEAALTVHPALRQAVAMARKDRSGEPCLVAYLVPHGDSPPAAELRAFLQQRLPDYMVPAVFVPLGELPLTPNGKVDRRALPAPDGEALRSSAAFAPARTPAEEILVQVWQEVLGVDRVGVHDSFFELGGHSLLGVRLFARIREAFGVDVPLQTLFQAPTVADLAARVAELQGRETGESAPAALPEVVVAPAERHEPFPLTDVQQAYWVGRSGAMELGRVSCHVYSEVETAGLDLDRLNAAWRRLIDRHDMLRAVFLSDGRQRILESVPAYTIAVTDLSGEDPATVAERLEAVRGEMSHQVLPADRWPLFDIRASRLPSGRVRLHVGFDLLIGDAWSFQVLQRELFQLYQEPDKVLPPLGLSFRDYVMALQAIEGSEAYRRSRDYWTRRLPSLPPSPELPLQKEPEAAVSGRFVRQTGRLDAASWKTLQQRASRAGITPSGVLLTAYGETLAAWSRKRRLSVVVTLFNRLPLHPQVDELVGDFTSLTLLEVDMSGDRGFASRGRRLQERLWEDLDHRHHSSVRVLRDLIQTQGWSARAAMPVVFTSTLNLDAGLAAVARQRIEVDLVYGITQTPQVLLDHQVSEDANGDLIFAWDAVEELFPPGLLEDMFGAYCRRLRQLVESEAAWTAPASLVPAEHLERRVPVQTSSELPELLLHTGFEMQALRHPERTAVAAGGRSLTYGELFALASRTGRRLREMGARPNRLVAVALEKGWEQAVAVLGVLAAGAAYLPVDPDLPRERIHHLLERGEADLVLTSARLDAGLEWPEGVRRLAVDREEDWAGVDDSPLPPVQEWDDLAYVIFTSGSTGEPKGVMIDHRGALNTVLDVNRRFGVGPEDRVLALSALNFDLSVYDLFGLLAAGGTIVMPSPERRQDPAHWAELLERERITIWNSVPALLQMLVEYAGDRRGILPDSLRLVLLSGDWISVHLPGRVRALADGVTLISMGGATEASIWSILYPIGEVDPAWKSIPYGRPMIRQSFHVLDDLLDPCPDWVPGELYIGGIGLALGYWRDEARTRASFIDHPRTGERLYRTGDLGRYLPDGEIEFLGREDFQVKVQGYRIELGEIEAALSRHPGVREAVVTALGEPRGEKRLVAYVVADPAAIPDIPESELRLFLSERLPSYMVPRAFVYLSTLPLTANGKVDRRALPEPGTESGTGGAPRALDNPLERRLVEICGEVFPQKAVRIEDNFFELGGTSISAVWLISRIREEFRVELPLATLFQAPSLLSLSTAILQSQAAREDADELERMLAELEAISPEEMERLLSEGAV